MDPGPSTSDGPTGATPIGNSPPEESIAILTSMGFPRAHSIHALKATVRFAPALPTDASFYLINKYSTCACVTVKDLVYCLPQMTSSCSDMFVEEMAMVYFD